MRLGVSAQLEQFPGHRSSAGVVTITLSRPSLMCTSTLYPNRGVVFRNLEFTAWRTAHACPS